MKEQDVWLNAKLGEISKEIKPGYPSGKHNSIGNGKLHFRPYNISNEGEVNLTQSKFVPLKNEDYYLKSQDIVFNNTNSPELLGKTCIVSKDTDWVYSNHMTRIRLKPNFDPRFYAKYLHYLKYKGFYKTYCSNHVNQASIASGFLNRNLEVPICPLPEQRAIVSKIEQLFSELDNGIANLKLAHEQLKVYRQAVLKKAFEGELTRKWREQKIDLLNDDLLQQIQKEREKVTKTGKKIQKNNQLNEKKLAELPKGWFWTRLGNLVEEPKYGTSKKCDYNINGIGVLRIPNISNGLIDDSDLKFSQFDSTEIENYKLKAGDILTIRSNGSVDLVGKCALVSSKDEKYLYAGYLIRLRSISPLINSKYLINCLSSIDLRNQIESKAKSTSGVNNINSGELQSLIIPICSHSEQQIIIQEIETRLSICDKIEQDIEANLEKAEALRQSILKKAFEGKLLNEKELAEVRRAEDWEPAEVLLQRIKAERMGK